jgi:geranylgeranyl reductase family protein
MRRIRDVIVIGAGPAGTATAARLHQQGVCDVLVLDRERFPRDKPCGGGLTGRVDEALAELDLSLSVPRVPSHVARIRFGAFARSALLARPVNVVRRVDFDASLVEQVRELGIGVRLGARVERLVPGRDAVSLLLDSGEELAARVVVGADGVGSVVRKHLCGARRMLPHRLFMQEVPAPRRETAMVYDFTPMLAGLRGYLWIFPLTDGRANVGLMHYPSTRQAGPELRRVLREGLRVHGIELPDRGARGWPVWGYEPGTPLAASRLLTVGDAAGIDSLTGEGISVALEQAMVAGDAAACALRTGDFAFTGYASALRKADVGRELALDRWLARKLYQAGGGWQYWLSLMLYDREFVDLYAARVAGTGVLADRKLRILLSLAWHWLVATRRRQRLSAAMAGDAESALAAAGG